MIEKFSVTDEKEFYNTFKELNPAVVLGLILISGGLYIIAWMYSQNKEMEKIDEDSPELTRCAFILFGFPFTWLMITVIIKFVFFNNVEVPQAMIISEITVWTFIIMLIFKYIFDFCKTFSKITRTNTLIWFVLISLGIVGLIGVSIQSFFLTPFAFFLAMTIPAMQEELNHVYHKSEMKRKDDTYYST